MTELKKSVNVHAIKQCKFKTNIIGFLMRTKLERENATKLSLLSGILKSSCMKYEKHILLERYLEELYGAVFDCSILKKGDEQILFFYFEFLNASYANGLLNKCAEFLSEVILNPLVCNEEFDSKVFKLQKNTLVQKLKSKKDDKKNYAVESCLKVMWEGESFGVDADGYIEDLNNIDEKNLYEYYKNFVDNCGIDIICSGDFEEYDLKLIFGKYFDSLNDRDYRVDFERSNNIKEIKNVHDIEDVSQGKLCMGFKTDLKSTGNDFYNFLLLNEILGGGAASKLYNKIRQKESLCYYVNSFFYRFKMSLIIQAGIADENFEKTVQLINETLDEINKDDIKQEELESAKDTLLEEYEKLDDEQTSVMDFYLTQYILNDSTNIKKFKEGIKSVNLNGVKEASMHLKPCAVYFLSSSKESEGKTCDIK